MAAKLGRSLLAALASDQAHAGDVADRKLGDRLFAMEMWQPERIRFASGCAIGVFFAIMPLPFQMLAAALIAYLVRVNIPAAIACTWVSNPLTTPLILFAQYRLGSMLIRAPASEARTDDVLTLLPRPRCRC